MLQRVELSCREDCSFNEGVVMNIAWQGYDVERVGVTGLVVALKEGSPTLEELFTPEQLLELEEQGITVNTFD